MADEHRERPRKAGEVWVHRESDQVAAYVPETGHLHALNPSAMAIWDLCDGTTTVGEMIQAVAELTDADLSQAERDVLRTLDELAKRGLVEGWWGAS